MPHFKDNGWGSEANGAHPQRIIYTSLFLFSACRWKWDSGPSLKVYPQVCLSEEKNLITSERRRRSFHRTAVDRSLATDHYDLGWTPIVKADNREERNILSLSYTEISIMLSFSFPPLSLSLGRVPTWRKIDTTGVYFESSHEGTRSEYWHSRQVRRHFNKIGHQRITLTAEIRRKISYVYT